MPLDSVSASEALGRLRAEGRRVLWPDQRHPNKRLEGLAEVTSRPSFTIGLDDRIFTMGSCFARNIERRLGQIGFVTPMYDAELAQGLRSLGYDLAFLNKYSAATIRAEIEWACGLPQPPEASILLRLPEGSAHDLFLTPDRKTGLPLEAARQARALVQARARRLPECRIFVLTLGLAEVWRDTESGLWINGMPPTSALLAEPDRFVLDVLSYDDILADLEAIHAVLSRHGHSDFKILITVSPVPMRMTFRAADAISANSYSKAVQRAAVEAFVMRHANVDYFSSFEQVTLSDRRVAYENDNRHVQPGVVSRVVDGFLQAYAPDVTLPAIEEPLQASKADATAGDLAIAARLHMDERRYVEAARLFSELFERFGERDPDLAARRISPLELRRLYSGSLMKLGQRDAALQQLELALADEGATGEGLLRCVESFLSCKALDRAEQCLSLAEARGADGLETRYRRALVQVAQDEPAAAAATLSALLTHPEVTDRLRAKSEELLSRCSAPV